MWHLADQNDRERSLRNKEWVQEESGSEIRWNTQSEGQKTRFQSFTKSKAAVRDKVVPGKNAMCVQRGEMKPCLRCSHKAHSHQREFAQANNSAINHIHSVNVKALSVIEDTILISPFFKKIVMVYLHTFSVSDVPAYLASLSLGDLAALQNREPFLGKRWH